MDGYFQIPPAPITLHAPYAPEAAPMGNTYQINQSVVTNFWSVRDQWLDAIWVSQSEVSVGASVADVQPDYIPYESQMTQVVLISW